MKNLFFAFSFFIILLLALIILNQGGKDPLTAIGSPDKSKQIVVSVKRFGDSNTFVDVYFAQENFYLQAAEIKGAQSATIEWMNNGEVNVAFNKEFEIVKENKELKGLKINYSTRIPKKYD